jgi:hypothetical protein
MQLGSGLSLKGHLEVRFTGSNDQRIPYMSAVEMGQQMVAGNTIIGQTW